MPRREIAELLTGLSACPFRALPSRAGISCHECSLRELPVFRPFANPELHAIIAIRDGERRLEAGQLLLQARKASRHLYTLYQGWAARYRTLPNGSEQIVDLVLPGDAVGLETVFAQRPDYSVRTLSAAIVCTLRADRIPALLRSHPSLAESLAHTLLLERARLDRSLTAHAHMSAAERLGHLFLEVRQRLRERRLFRGRTCPWLLDRSDLASVAGLSRAHLMRALRELRTRGLADLRGRALTIPDERRLAHFSHYTFRPKGAALALL